jgi:hypothetical protein
MSAFGGKADIGLCIQEHEHQGGDDGGTGKESDVSKDVEYPDFVGMLESNYSHQLLSPSGR